MLRVSAVVSGAEAGEAAEHRGAAGGVLQVPGECVPVLAVAGEGGADLAGLRTGPQVVVEHGRLHCAVLALEDQVLHLAGEAQRIHLGRRREGPRDRGACGAHPVGGVLLRATVRSVTGGVPALAAAIVRPTWSISAAFAEEVPRSRQRRPCMWDRVWDEA